MVLTFITALVATKICDKLIDKGSDFFLDKGMNGLWDFAVKDRDSFVNELSNIVDDSMVSFEELHPFTPADDKIPFYKSQVMVEELLKFTFTGDLDLHGIQDAINTDNRISAPTNAEVNELLHIFHNNVWSNAKLKDLFVKENYQKEIFNISRKVSEITTSLESHVAEIKNQLSQLTAPDLCMEWSQQLDEIKEDYKLLKHRTARTRIINLRQRMVENGISDNKLLAKAISLQTDCSATGFDENRNKEVQRLHIEAYKLVPSLKEYKEKACMAYLVLGEALKATNLAKELLAVDEFNIVAWLILSYADGMRLSFITNEVPPFVRNDKSFQLNIIYKLIAGHRFEEVDALLQSGYSFLEIGDAQPDSIASGNLMYWATWTTVAIVLYLSGKKEFKNASIKEDAYNLPRLLQIQKLLTLIIAKIRATEIEDDFLFLRFQYYYLNLLVDFNDADLQALLETHNRFKDRELNHSITFQLIRALAASGKPENMLVALEVIDKHPETESNFFLLFKISHFSSLNEMETVSKLVEEYYTSITVIDQLNIANILQLFTLHYERYPDIAISRIRTLAKEKEATNLGYLQLIEVNTDIAEGKSDVLKLKSDIEQLFSNLSGEPDYIKNIVVRLCIGSKHYGEAYDFLSSYVDPKIMNETSWLYFDVLYSLPEKRVALKSMLSVLRSENVRFSKNMVEYDRTLAKAEYDYVLLKDICIYGLQFYPDASILIYDLFLSLHQLKNSNGIADNIARLENFNFEIDASLSISICQILFENGFVNEFLDLTYKLASNKGNTKLREYYVSKLLTSAVPIELQETVALSTCVSYSIDGTSHTIEITQENLETPAVALLIGKKLKDEFVHTSGYTTHKVIILEILYKYSALLKSIMKDTENPLNGFGIQQFSIDEESDEPVPQQIISKLIEKFGPREEVRAQQLNTTFEEYYINELPFALAARKIFQDNAIEAYLFFSSEQSKAFRIPPSYFYQNLLLEANDTFVLDIPSAVLLYQLATDYNIQLKEMKLVIPNTTKILLEDIIKDVNSDKGSVGNFRVSTSGVKSTFYADDFQSKRLEYIEGIVEWIMEQCEVITVPERLETIPDLDHEILADIYMQALLDNLLLSQRPGFRLVASDMSYFSFLQGDAKSIISIEALLLSGLATEDTKAAHSVLLNKNLVGITISDSDLKEHFIARIGGSHGKYLICLENLAVGWNSIKNIEATICHVKWILTTPTLADNLKLMYAEEVFRAMIPGIENDEAARELIVYQLNKQFALLSSTMLQTARYCLRNAIHYYRAGAN